VTELPPTPPPSGPPSGTEGAPLVDWPAFLEEYDGQLPVVEKLVQTVLRTRGADPAKLRTAADTGDVATVRFLAHGLKTVGGLIKCASLRDAARAVENAAAGAAPEAPALARSLADLLDRMLAELAPRAGTPAP
jgi:hypothetical protein